MDRITQSVCRDLHDRAALGLNGALAFGEKRARRSGGGCAPLPAHGFEAGAHGVRDAHDRGRAWRKDESRPLLIPADRFVRGTLLYRVHRKSA